MENMRVERRNKCFCSGCDGGGLSGFCVCSNGSSRRRAHLCQSYQNSTSDSSSSSRSSSSRSSSKRATLGRLRSLLRMKTAGAKTEGGLAGAQASYRLPAVGLDIQGLERFLLYTVPRFSLHPTMASQAKTGFSSLADKWRLAEQSASSKSTSTSTSGSISIGRLIKQQLQRAAEQCYDELNGILILLGSFLNCSSPSSLNSNGTNNCVLPPVVVYEVHLYVGQIQEVLQMTTNVRSRRRSHSNKSNSNFCTNDTKFNDAAMASYMKALWVASFSKDISHDLLALVLHRLGKLSGRMGKVRQARDMLYRAVQLYSMSGNVPHDHPTLLDAEEFYNRFHFQTLAVFGSTMASSVSSLSDSSSSLAFAYNFSKWNRTSAGKFTISEDSEFFACRSESCHFGAATAPFRNSSNINRMG